MEVLNPISEINIISMKNMVDLALGTPEVGAVNFNILHTLLHAILSKLQLDDSTVDIPTEKVDAKDSKSHIVPASTIPYHGLQERIKILESQISNLNSLPSNPEILQNILDPAKNAQTGSDTQRAVSELWQTINIRKKVNANEEGIDRLSSMIDSILDEMKRLKSDNDNMKKQLADLSNLKGMGDKVDGLQNDLANLLAQFNALKDKMDQYPSPESLKNIVTWDALEKALKGIKDDMEELKKPTERIVVNMATEPMSRPTSASSGGPSEVCAEMLEKLGVLTTAHDLLDKRVVVLEMTLKPIDLSVDDSTTVSRSDGHDLSEKILNQEEMPNKADKKDLDNLRIPDDLLKTINQLKAQMEAMMSAKNRAIPEIVNTDTEALSRIRDILNSLQEKMNAVNETVEKLAAENKDLLTQIEELFGVTKDHENRKADIGYVDGLMRTKADKSLLDTKVSFTLFDETTGNLHNLIDDVLKKLLAAEEELRNLLRSLAQDLEGKVDKDDLNTLKEWIEKRLRALAEKLKNLRGGDYGDDDAAGLRKQLLQHFHCISCDRPVDVLAHGANYNNGLPEPKGLPPTKSFRPYATFELDAIRQHSKNMPETRVINPKYVSYGNDIVDVYQTPRPCGGSHTTTYPQKKIVRLSNINNSFVEEEVYTRAPKEELDLQGADGHIYKGRFDRNQTTLINNSNYNEPGNNDKLPPVTSTQRSQTINNFTPRGGFVTSRPKSALKLTPRHTSSGGSGRPSSARVTVPEPDSRPTSPNLNDDHGVDINYTDADEPAPVDRFDNENNLNNETTITSDNFNIELINHSESELQSTDEVVLL